MNQWLSASSAIIGLCLVMALILRSMRRSTRRRETFAAFAIRTPRGIQEAAYVSVGGIDQWISIRGEDRANPVILVLHGGPATSYMAMTPLFRLWEPYFTVVQWDRRGVGKTFGRNGRAGSGELTLERIAADGNELAELLATRLQKRKIILLGHSMGSMIGISMAARRADLFHAYVGTEQIIDMPRNEALSYRIILDRLRSQGNGRRVRALEKIGPPPYSSPRTWGTKQFAAEAADPVYGELSKKMQRMARDSPSYSLKDHLNVIGGSLLCVNALYSQWMRFDAHALGARFATPIFLIQGATDIMVPPQIAAEWLGGIEAPHKEMIVVEGASHMPMATAAEAYLRALVVSVRPLAAEFTSLPGAQGRGGTAS